MTVPSRLFAAAVGVALWAVFGWEEVTWAVDGEVDEGVHHGGGFGPRFAAHEFHHGFNHDNFHHFHNRRVFVSSAFFFGGYPYYGYGNCYWLKRRAIITGSRYWWSRYEDCVGYY